MAFVLYLTLFLMGAVMGSFLNVLIVRTVEGEDWVKGRSRCDHCGHKISWYDNIPVLSFVALRGRCRYCKEGISYQYPLIEIITGVLFVWWGFLGFSFFQLVRSPFVVLQPLYWLAIGFVFVGVLFVDLYYGIIPDSFVVFGYVISIFYRVLLVTFGPMRLIDFVYSLISVLGVFLFFNFLYKITKEKGMGYGDVKFAPLMGLVLGWPDVLAGLFFSFTLGALVGVFLIVLGKKKFGQSLPFGPFLVLGSFVGLLWAEGFFKILGF